MASSTITRVGGVVIVTQVIPQDEQANIALQDTPTAHQATPIVHQDPPTAPQTPPPSPIKKDEASAMFLRGQPFILGVFQICLGLLMVLCGLTAVFSPVLILHAPICAAIIFVISGSVTLKTAKTTTVCTLGLAAGWSVLSAVLSVVGVAYVSFLLTQAPPSTMICGDFTPNNVCYNNIWSINMVVSGLQILVLVLAAMELAVSITVTVFSVKTIKRYPPQEFLSEAESDVSLLHE